MSTEGFPNFLIVGAARSGTSSLYEYMKQHPEVYFSENKEPMFFSFYQQNVDFKGPGDNLELNRKSVTDPEAYKALFRDARQAKAIGEASANYLYSRTAADNIKRFIPDVKIIAVLRNPVERAYSSYLYTLRDGREPLSSFEEALAQEDERIQDHWEHIWHYRRMGFYHEQLSYYYQQFPADNILVILQEDLKSDTAGVLRTVFEFLEVDAGFTPDFSVEYNQGGKPKNAWLNSVLTRPMRIKQWLRPLLPRKLLDAYIHLKHKNLDKPELLPETRQSLRNAYRTDIQQLEQLIHRDLSHWLAVKEPGA